MPQLRDAVEVQWAAHTFAHITATINRGQQMIDYETAAKTFEEIPALSGGKRCGVQWTPWMGDWFTSWSPRNSNSNAEGPWEHWVHLAERILAHPMTKVVKEGRALDEATIAAMLSPSDGDSREV